MTLLLCFARLFKEFLSGISNPLKPCFTFKSGAESQRVKFSFNSITRGIKMVKLWAILLISSATWEIVLTRKVDDEVVPIDSINFHSLVESSDKFWVIQYYIPWCGACANFDPIFLALARSNKDWDFIRFGEISCPVSPDLCASHGGSTVPDVKLLIPSPKSLEIKPIMPENKIIGVFKAVTNNLLDQLNALQQNHPIASTKLPLLRQVSDFTDMQFNHGEGASDIFLIVESPARAELRIAEFVILDLYRYRDNFRIFRTSLKNAEDNMNVFQPGLYRFSQNGTFVEIESKSTRDSMKNAILASIGGAGSNSSPNTTNVDVPTSKPKLHEVTYVYRKAHGLHMADLITGLRYMLWTEVPMLAKIDNEARSALMKYLKILIKYHPADLQIIQYLQLLYEWLDKHPAPIASNVWTEALKSLESPEAYIPSNTTWKGCKGSEDHLRGYPCSLWMTFHTLTVRAYLDQKNRAPSTDDHKIGLDILLAIRGFIERFFSCSECSRNFVYHSRDWLTQAPNDWTPKRAALDLWKRHNSVNSRLHLQPLTEDPNHPKIQFPAMEDCSECRKAGQKPSSVFVSNPTDWDLENVFQFLTEYYGSPKVASCAEKGKMSFSSKWTSCSKTCGTGLSMRLSNNNEDCILKVETRLCFDRPCSLKFPDWARSPWHKARCPKIGHTYQMNDPVEFRFHNCTAKVNRKRKICGLCPMLISSRKPICCKPFISRTEYLDFRCSNSVDDAPVFEEDGAWLNMKNGNDIMVESTKIAVEMIELCHCSETNCDNK